MSASRYHGVEGRVGRTPLIRLRRLSELTGSEILGKAEFMNLGGSVKDRAALGIILDAESTGRLHPGDTIVEGTAGEVSAFVSAIGTGGTLAGTALYLKERSKEVADVMPKSAALSRPLSPSCATQDTSTSQSFLTPSVGSTSPRPKPTLRIGPGLNLLEMPERWTIPSIPIQETLRD